MTELLLACKFCSKECKNKNSLAQHQIRCKLNPDRRDFDKLSKYITTYRKGQTKVTMDEIKRQAAKLVGRVGANKGRVGTFKGHKHSAVSKNKCSKSTKEFLSRNNVKSGARYSIVACDYIDELNLKYG